MTQARGKNETVLETSFVISRSLFSLMLQLCATAFIPCSCKSDVNLQQLNKFNYLEPIYSWCYFMQSYYVIIVLCYLESEFLIYMT